MDPNTEDQKITPQSPGIGGERDLGIKESGAEVPLDLPPDLQQAGLKAEPEVDHKPFRINNPASGTTSTPVQEPKGLDGFDLSQSEKQSTGDPKSGLVDRAQVAVRQLRRRLFNREVF